MKCFHKYKFILFVCITVLIFQTGCVDDSPIGTMIPDSTQDIQNTEMNLTQISELTQDIQNTKMNLTQIQVGDYSSLLGTWKEIAYANNMFDGKGMQWHTGRTDTDSSTLSVSTDKINFNNSAVIVQGNTLTDSESSYILEFYNNGTRLYADLADRSTTTNWTVSFYPRGVANGYEPNNGVQIDNTKNLIVIWYSGMRVLTVFGQE